VVEPERTALWTLGEIAAVTGGRTEDPSRPVYGISIDSREIAHGDLFVALTAERDGHDFVPAAMALGAAASLVTRKSGGPEIVVGDTLQALQVLGAAARDRATHSRRAAVTGSVGKTSVTQAIAASIALAGPSHASVKSYNNHIGVPLTLARMPRETRLAVFEIGMNHADEITPLSQMVRPHVAVVTRVGPVHVENFPDGVIGVARAKAEIFDGIGPGAIAVLNADDDWFELLRAAALARGAQIRTFGRSQNADARLLSFQVEGNVALVSASLHGEPLSFELVQTGQHWGLNALATLLAVEALGAPRQAALEGLKGLAPLAGRGEATRVRLAQGDVILIDDSYNANPVSMQAALESLGAYAAPGRRIVVLSDMLEISDSAALHASLAAPIEAAGVDAAFLAGSDMKALHDALPASRRGAWRPAAEDLAPLVLEALQPGDVVMVKGSKGSKASLVVEAIKAAGRTTKRDRPKAPIEGAR